MKIRSILTLASLLACGGNKDNNSDTGQSTVPVSCDDVGIDIPSGRGETSGAWDPKGHRLLMFGGNEAIPLECQPGATAFVGETWAYKQMTRAALETWRIRG